VSDFKTRTMLLLALALPAISWFPLTAQRPGTFELGGFGNWARFDSVLGYENSIGAGGRLGLFIVQGLAIEADFSYTETVDAAGDVISIAPIRTRLVYHTPSLWNVGLLMGAGFVHNEYRLSSRGADNGATGLAGLRIRFVPGFAVRLEALGEYVPGTILLVQDEDNGPPLNILQFGLQVGVSFYMRLVN
jgi:hypothetical protein